MEISGSNTPNDYANAEVVELTASATVDCVILDATGSSAFGSCISGPEDQLLLCKTLLLPMMEHTFMFNMI